jgi:quinol monooxygenase YgiN
MPETPPVAVLVHLRIREGLQEPFLAELRTVLKRVREEPACLSIQGYQDPQDRTRFTLVEIWRSAEEFHEFDGNREYLHAYLERAQQMWAQPRDLSIMAEVA